MLAVRKGLQVAFRKAQQHLNKLSTSVSSQLMSSPHTSLRMKKHRIIDIFTQKEAL